MSTEGIVNLIIYQHIGGILTIVDIYDYGGIGKIIIIARAHWSLNFFDNGSILTQCYPLPPIVFDLACKNRFMT